MQNIKRVLIVGIGLIGGSLALAIKSKHKNIKVIGYDVQADSLSLAKKLQVIDEISTDFAKASIEADVIILATPVRTSIKYLAKLINIKLKDNVIITDVGSTKSEIVKAAATISNQGIAFVGGHPMAGSHKSGVMAADVNLFENAYYLLTPTTPQMEEKAQILADLLNGTRAKFVVLSAHEHDQITGMLSHLPHIIAAGLVRQADLFMNQHPEAHRLAAGGFRDITRIASSDPIMWTDILLSNRDILLEQLTEWQDLTKQVKIWLETNDAQAINDFFAEAKITRDKLPIHQSGVLPAFYDLFVDIPDYPGIIAEITGMLAKENISLINVKILETREDVYGILQLTFKTEAALKTAKNCIETQTTYQCYEK